MTAKKKQPDFEEKMRDLESLIDKLEGESLSLEDSMATFEKAMDLSKQCARLLEEAQKRITVLMQNQTEVPFMDDEDDK